MAENKLSWTELRRALASRAGVSEKEANAFLNAFNAQLVEALKADKQVKINGLGTFKLQAVAPRKSVNVKTGAEITIEGYNKIAFTPEAGVKELVESNQSSEVSHPAEVDPLKKLGAQAEEIVDILGELGQSPKGESDQPSEVSIQPEKPVEPVEPKKGPEKPKKKFHFLRDTLICVVILLALLLVGYFFLRHQLSNWIDELVNRTERIEVVEKAKPVVEEPIVEEPAVEEPAVEEQVAEEPQPTVEAEPYKELILTEEIKPGSRLAWIAKKHYGDKAYWPYLYDANRDRIKDPSNIPVGTQIRVPKLSAAQRDTTSAAFHALKEEAYSATRRN